LIAGLALAKTNETVLVVFGLTYVAFGIYNLWFASQIPRRAE
jgi:hypothetical protein